MLLHFLLQNIFFAKGNFHIEILISIPQNQPKLPTMKIVCKSFFPRAFWYLIFSIPIPIPIPMSFFFTTRALLQVSRDGIYYPSFLPYEIQPEASKDVSF